MSEPTPNECPIQPPIPCPIRCLIPRRISARFRDLYATRYATRHRSGCRASAARPHWLHALLLLATVFTTLVVERACSSVFSTTYSVFCRPERASIFPRGMGVPSTRASVSGDSLLRRLAADPAQSRDGALPVLRRYRVWATLPYFIPFPSWLEPWARSFASAAPSVPAPPFSTSELPAPSRDSFRLAALFVD